MADFNPTEVLTELKARGYIAPNPAPQPLPAGNLDRKPGNLRSSWLVSLPAGGRARLLIDREMGPQAERHAAFAKACPAIATLPLFYVQLPQGDAHAEVFFDGPNLDDAIRHNLIPPEAIDRAMAKVTESLVTSEQASTEPARAAEWHAWAERFFQLSILTDSERRLLGEIVFPRLYARLAIAPPVKRWTNGDFIGSNLLLNSAGEVRLIDAEFAAPTHFFAEDAARFYALTPDARSHPGRFSQKLPAPGPAWHLFFWLRQLLLECENNSAEYLARMLPVRRAVIRRLAEQGLDCSLAGWPVAATDVRFHIETAHWVQTTRQDLILSGWCHAPEYQILNTIIATVDDHRLAEIPLTARPDVQHHFAGEAGALLSGFQFSVPLLGKDATVILSAVAMDGTLFPFHAIRSGDAPGRGPALGDYGSWAERYDADPSLHTGIPKGGPLFSILLPVHNTPPRFLHACLDSVRKQHYQKWELCVVDDGSRLPEVPGILLAAARDQRIRLQTSPANGGIARATNDALAMANGEFVVMLDHDDLLRPHALLELARHIRANPEVDAVYSDEDTVTADGQRTHPFFKPDFSPEFLLGVMYIGHALCVRTTVARDLGGFDPRFDGVQDYEFFLRVTERTRRIEHLPRILYHWRQSHYSSALQGNIKGDMDKKQAEAVRAHLRRRGRTEEVIALGGHRVRLQAEGSLPTAEVFASPGLEPPAWFHARRLKNGDQAIEWLWQAGQESSAEIIVLLTAQPLDCRENWIRELAVVAALPDSALVAPLLLAEDGKVLESGWVVGPEVASPIMRGFNAGGDGYHGSMLCTREVTAVSPVCVAVRRDLLLNALVNSNRNAGWIDFCLSLQHQGRFNRVCAAARIQVGRSWRSNNSIVSPLRCIADDRFYNRHFDGQTGDYRLRTDQMPPPLDRR